MEKAAQYSLENIMIDLKELEKGMDLTRKELDNRAKDKSKQLHTLQVSPKKHLSTSCLISPSFQGDPTICHKGIFLKLRINVL